MYSSRQGAQRGLVKSSAPAEERDEPGDTTTTRQQTQNARGALPGN